MPQFSESVSEGGVTEVLHGMELCHFRGTFLTIESGSIRKTLTAIHDFQVNGYDFGQRII